MAFFRASCYRPFSGKEPAICDAVKIILDILGFGAIILTFRVTQRICVTVAHRTLTPFAGVRIPHPLPIIKATQSGGFYYWQRMKLDSKGRHQCAHWCNKQSSGLFVSPWENPWTCRRTRMGVDVSPFSFFSPWEVLLLCRIQSLILCQKYQIPNRVAFIIGRG